MPVRRATTLRILLCSDGCEGRFLEWESGEWRAFNYYNYRLLFEPSPVNKFDLLKLRDLLHAGPEVDSRELLTQRLPNAGLQPEDDSIEGAPW